MKDHTELQRRLLQCVSVDLEYDGDGQGHMAQCERVSSYVVHAMRAASGGRRTDMTLFGLCDGHKFEWKSWVRDLGYSEGVCVEWAGLGHLLRELDEAGYLDRVAS